MSTALAPAPAERHDAPPDAAPAGARASGASRRARLLPWVVAVATLLLAGFAIGPWPVGVFFDDGVYAILAKALAEGKGFRYLHIPGEPGATHYPPGYPALLALLWKAWPSFPDNVVLMKAANAVLLAAASWGAVRFGMARYRLAAPLSAATVILFTAAVPVLVFTVVLFSEPLFLALLFPTLLVAERAAEEGRVRDAALAGLLIGVLVLVRTVGFVILPPLVLLLLVRRRWAAAVAAGGIAVLLVLPWQLWSSAHAGDLPPVLQGNYGPYLEWVIEGWRTNGAGFALRTVLKNLDTTGDTLRVLFVPKVLGFASVAVVATVVASLAAGLWRTWRLAPVTGGFLLGYLAIVFLWPYAPFRFLWGVWVLLGLTAVLGAAWMWPRRGERRALLGGRVAFAALALVAVVGNVAYNARGLAKGWWESAQRAEARNAMPGIRWVAANAQPGDVVASDYGPMMWLYTGRRALPTGSFTAEEYLVPQTPERAAADGRVVLSTYGVRWLVVASRTSGAAPGAQRMLESSPPDIVLVDTLAGGGAVFTPAPR